MGPHLAGGRRRQADGDRTCANRPLATQATIGIALTKRALDAAESNSLDAQLDLERDLQDEAAHTQDYAEGVRAFLEKRVHISAWRR